MSENDQDMLDEDKEAELLQALAAQAPAEEYVATSGEALPEGALLAARDDIVDALKTVSDPEIPINIYDMGFVYDIRQLNNGNVEIDMTLTGGGHSAAAGGGRGGGSVRGRTGNGQSGVGTGLDAGQNERRRQGRS